MTEIPLLVVLENSFAANEASEILRKLTIVFHHAGGGHRSAADALKTTLSSQEHPWDVTLLDIQELLDPLDLIRRATGLRIQDTYNLIFAKAGPVSRHNFWSCCRRRYTSYHSQIVKLLRDYWAAASGRPRAFRDSALQSRNR